MVEDFPAPKPEKLADYYRGKIFLLTKAQFDRVMDGTTLVDIAGEYVVKGRDYISEETQGGYMAYGFPVDKAPNWFDQNSPQTDSHEITDDQRRDERRRLALRKERNE